MPADPRALARAHAAPDRPLRRRAGSRSSRPRDPERRGGTVTVSTPDHAACPHGARRARGSSATSAPIRMAGSASARTSSTPRTRCGTRSPSSPTSWRAARSSGTPAPLPPSEGLAATNARSMQGVMRRLALLVVLVLGAQRRVERRAHDSRRRVGVYPSGTTFTASGAAPAHAASSVSLDDADRRSGRRDAPRPRSAARRRS